uniref:FGENESH: predicted gene_6.523 protein n=1 Tax=Rhodotorula toruloides TaxID=5286 RepID=A0A0K3CGR4_RHOTO
MLTHSLTLPLAVAASLLASSASAHPNHGHHNQVRHHHAHAHAKRAFVPVREALNARAVKGGRMQRKVRRGAQGAVLLAADSNSTSSSSDAGSTAKYSSTAIWWKEAGWVGSCGVTINEDDMVVALPLSVYPDVSTASPLCGSSVSDYTTFSKAAYVALEGNLDVGELPIEFVVDQSKVPAGSSSASTAETTAKNAKIANVNVKQTSSASSQAPSTTAPPKAQAVKTTAAPAPSSSASSLAEESGDDWVCDSTETGESATVTSKAAAPTADAAAAAASSKAAADAAWAASSSSSKAAADAAWAASSSSSAAAAAASSKAAAAAAASSKAAADAAWAASSSSSAAAAADDDSVPGFAPSLSTMLNNFGGDATAARQAYCGLEAIVTTPDGKSATLYVADAFDDTWVRTPSSLDIIYGAFAQLFGSQTSNKNDVVTGATWKFTGNRNPKYAYASTSSLS